MKIHLILTFLLSISAPVAHSQITPIDSLLQKLEVAPNDSVRFKIYKSLSSSYFETNRRKHYEYNEQALQLAEKNNMLMDLVYCLDNRGYYLNKEHKYGEALKSYIQAFEIAEDPQNESKTWQKLSKNQAHTNRLNALAALHHSMGHIYRSTNDPQKAIQEYKNCKVYLEMKETTGFNTADMNIGRVFYDIGMLDSALVYELEAEQVHASRNHNEFTCFVKKYLGDIYLKKGAFSLAKEYYYQGITSANEENNWSGLINLQMGLANLYLAQSEKDSCLYYAQKVYNGFNQIKGNPGKDIDQGVVYTLLYQAYQLRNQQDSTFKYLQLAFYANDSINHEKIKNLSSYQNLSFDEQVRLQKLEKEKIKFEAKIRTYALLAGLSVFLIITLILFRNNRQKQKSNIVLLSTLEDLKSTQAQLINSEKMASLGELTAGIAHEIQNPLNFVNNFSEVSNELIVEMREELDKGDIEEAKSIATDIEQNLQKINHHGKRADGIVKGMLQHSRSGSGEMELTDINALADEYLRLAYHGLRAKDQSFNAKLKTDFDASIGNIKVVQQDIGRVILNLITNAFYAVSTPKSPKGDLPYEPTVIVKTKLIKPPSGGLGVEISVTDNGNGIPQHILDKIFQPFFTTKPAGQGTGLGLSLSYDIVKSHGGTLTVESTKGEGAIFTISLPII